MNFQPVIPIGGFAGWSFLNRTRVAQQQAFESSAQMARDVTYFKDNIGAIATAEDLVADRRLLKVALGAFGLDDDINNKFFIRKVLDDGTIDDKALANRLSDKRYVALSKAFGFGDSNTPSTVLSGFGDKITTAYKDRQFEIAVGKQNPNMRLAMGLDRALAEITGKATTDDGRWFLIMGQPPLRTVFETALGLPRAVGAIDLDLQLKAFRGKAAARFGNGEVAQFADPQKREELVRLFLVRAEISAGSGTLSGGSVALTLLQNASGIRGGILNFLG